MRNFKICSNDLQTNRKRKLLIQIREWGLGVSGPEPDRNISPTSLSGPKICSGPGSDLLGSPGRSEPGPEILGPHNDLGVWSLSGPDRCLVLLHREFGIEHFAVNCVCRNDQIKVAFTMDQPDLPTFQQEGIVCLVQAPVAADGVKTRHLSNNL